MVIVRRTAKPSQTSAAPQHKMAVMAWRIVLYAVALGSRRRRQMVRVDGVRALLRVRVALSVLRVCGGAAAAFQYTRVDFSAATYSSSAARSWSGAARTQHHLSQAAGAKLAKQDC